MYMDEFDYNKKKLKKALLDLKLTIKESLKKRFWNVIRIIKKFESITFYSLPISLGTWALANWVVCPFFGYDFIDWITAYSITVTLLFIKNYFILSIKKVQEL